MITAIEGKGDGDISADMRLRISADMRLRSMRRL